MKKERYEFSALLELNMPTELKTRLVFIDTSAYESKNYQFGEYALKALEHHLQAGHLYLLITTITVEEIEAHLEKKSHEAEALLKRFQKDAKFLRNAPNLPSINVFQKISSADIFKESRSRFNTFLKSENVEIVGLSNVNCDEVFDRYFASKPPFVGEKKKSEFPDAFALAAVEYTAVYWSSQTGHFLLSIFEVNRRHSTVGSV